MNRSIVEEMSKIKHLKMTGQTEEFFERWRREWDEIVTSHMPKVEELLFEAEDCADKYRFQKSKQVLAHIENLLSAAESNIEDILKEIADLVSSEEQNRKEIEEVKERYTKVRKNLWHTVTCTETSMRKLKPTSIPCGKALNSLKRKQKAEII